MPRKLTTRTARKMAKSRINPSGGRQGRKTGAISTKPRCPCGEMTETRAAARCHKCP